MRLFQQQAVYNPASNPSPSVPPPPPFLPDEEEERRLCLLRESSTYLREGRQRLPTPDRVAIMELSSSFKKRRLGKQQQILSDITQRCREQEVTDLSSHISAKVELRRSTHEADEDPASVYASLTGIPPPMRSKPIRGSLSTGDLRDLDSVEKRVKSEKGYKFFPARKIMRRQPTRLQLITSSLLPPSSTSTSTSTRGGAGGGGGGGGGGSFFRDPPPGTSTTWGGVSRTNTDILKSIRHTDLEKRGSHTLDRQLLHGSFQPKADGMAPFLLPNLHGLDITERGGGGEAGGEAGGEGDYGGRGGGGDEMYPETYFTSSRLPLNQRSRSFLDTASVSGRSYRSLHTSGPRPTGSRHHLRSMTSQRPRPVMMPGTGDTEE